MKRLAGGIAPELVPPSGPAPALIRFGDLAKVIGDYESVTEGIEKDPEAVKVLGERVAAGVIVHRWAAVLGGWAKGGLRVQGVWACGLHAYGCGMAG